MLLIYTTSNFSDVSTCIISNLNIFILKDCQTLVSVLDDGIEKLMLMHSKDGDEDNLPNLHHDYGKPELPFSEDAIELIKEDIATVENFISEYFKKSKNKRSGIRKENDSLSSYTY